MRPVQVNFIFRNRHGNVTHVQQEHRHALSHKYNSVYQDIISLILFAFTASQTAEAALMLLLALFATQVSTYLHREAAFRVQLSSAQLAKVIAALFALKIVMGLIAPTPALNFAKFVTH